MRLGETDLTSCDREPIHIPGSIQPHGLLLVLDTDTLTVVQIAGDCQSYFGLPAEALIGQAIEAHIGSAAKRRLEKRFLDSGSKPGPLLPLELEIVGRRIDANAYRQDALVILELEPRRVGADDDALDLVHSMIGRLRSTETLETLQRSISRQIQQVTGFDRVMVYRFQEDASGHVVAESRSSEQVPSFLDLHYPASDIPAQARELYRKTWIRYIPDARYAPAPLFPGLNPRTGQPLDLSLSRLRAVSPMHLEYLHNMDVRSSLSLSLIVGGRLWGLIACHAKAPLYLSGRLRAALEMFAQLASFQLSSCLERGDAKDRLHVRDVHDQLTRAMSLHGLADALIGSRPNLLDYIHAAGVAVRLEGQNHHLGKTPTDEQLDALVDWLCQTQPEGVFATDHLAQHYPPARSFQDCGAGVLALSVSRQPRDYVLWFLPEVVSTTTWAGDPNKPVMVGALGQRLTPRRSFAMWQETVTERSRPWRTVEIEATELLRTTVLEVVLHRVDQSLREQEKARQQQDLLMGELDHRVKNTMATIQSLVRLSSRSATDLVSFTSAIEKRLQSMSKAHSLLSASQWVSASLRTIVEDEIAAQRSEFEGVIRVVGGDFALEPRTALSFALVLHELIVNAMKHGSLSTERGRVDLTWQEAVRPDKTWLVFQWKEIGGPQVHDAGRRGFGRTLLERVFAGDVSGKVMLTMEPTGVCCTIEIPFEKIVGSAAATKIEQTVEAPVNRAAALDLSGLRVLVVEDEGLIAMDVVEILERAGAIVVGCYARIDDGLEAAADQAFDVALLDVNLGGKTSWPIVSLVQERGIPILLSTAYSESFARPATIGKLPFVAKPYESSDLVARLLRTSARADQTQDY